MAEEVPARVPGAERAVIEERKLTGWVLAEHGHGPDFRRALGADHGDRDLIRAALLVHVREQPVEGVRPSHRLAGPRARDWAVLGPVEIRDQQAWVRSVWQVSDEGTAPRLITAYPCRPR